MYAYLVSGGSPGHCIFQNIINAFFEATAQIAGFEWQAR